MFAKQVIGYVLILAIGAFLLAAWRLAARKRRRERGSSRINLIDRD